MPEQCKIHDEDIRHVKETVSKQAGQWKLLLAGFGVFGVILSTIFTLQYQSQQRMTEAISNLDKVMTETILNVDSKITAYMSGNFERQNNILSVLDDHEQRIRSLEREK